MKVHLSWAKADRGPGSRSALEMTQGGNVHVARFPRRRSLTSSRVRNWSLFLCARVRAGFFLIILLFMSAPIIWIGDTMRKIVMIRHRRYRVLAIKIKWTCEIDIYSRAFLGDVNCRLSFEEPNCSFALTEYDNWGSLSCLRDCPWSTSNVALAPLLGWQRETRGCPKGSGWAGPVRMSWQWTITNCKFCALPHASVHWGLSCRGWRLIYSLHFCRGITLWLKFEFETFSSMHCAVAVIN